MTGGEEIIRSHPFLRLLMALVVRQEYETCHRLLGIVTIREQRACRMNATKGSHGVILDTDQHVIHEDSLNVTRRSYTAKNVHYFAQFEALLGEKHKGASADVALLVLYSQLFNFCKSLSLNDHYRHQKFLVTLFDEVASRFLNSGTIFSGSVMNGSHFCEVESLCLSNDSYCLLRLLMTILEAKVELPDSSIDTIGSICLDCVINGMDVLHSLNGDYGSATPMGVPRRSPRHSSILSSHSPHPSPVYKTPISPSNVIEELLTPCKRYVRDASELSDDSETLLKCTLHLVESKGGYTERFISQIYGLPWSPDEKKLFFERLKACQHGMNEW